MGRTLTRLLGGLQVKLPRHLGGFFRNDADHRDFAAIGTAAGALSGITKRLFIPFHDSSTALGWRHM